MPPCLAADPSFFLSLCVWAFSWIYIYIYITFVHNRGAWLLWKKKRHSLDLRVEKNGSREMNQGLVQEQNLLLTSEHILHLLSANYLFNKMKIKIYFSFWDENNCEHVIKHIQRSENKFTELVLFFQTLKSDLHGDICSECTSWVISSMLYTF